MPLNPVMFPRRHGESRPNSIRAKPPLGITTPLLATAAVVAAVATLQWPRRWLLSGCGVESLVLIYGSRNGTRILGNIPLWTILATLNVIYAVSSTSWLLYLGFTAFMVPCVGLTCLLQFTIVADFVRKNFRNLLKQLHFTRDKIALFNLPAMEIDTEVDGLMVIRGLTIQLSSLTAVAHGIELGIKLADDIELAAHCEEVTIRLFREIKVGDVLANIKGGSETTFAEIEEDTEDTNDDDGIFTNTALLRAATVGSEGFKDRPKLRESLTGAQSMTNISAGDGLDQITTLSPDDAAADQKYRELLNEIRRTSAIYQSRADLRQKAGVNGVEALSERQLLAAVCTGMHELPSVPHPPERSIKVTTLQNLSSPATRRFLHRLPFLLRLLLMVLSYFHTITFASISAAGSGKWFKAVLQQQIFRHYADHNAELRRLQRKISHWLNDANFCIQLIDVTGQTYVPLSTDYSSVAQLKLSEVVAYRTLPDSGSTAQVLRLGGADASFTIPSFLLPHHEHIIPPEPTKEDKAEFQVVINDTDDKIKSVRAESELKRVLKDETVVTMSVHGSLPAVLDQSLLNFVAAVVKATKVIEFEKDADQDVNTVEDDASRDPVPGLERVSTIAKSKFKAFSKRTFQSLADGTTKEDIRQFTRDLNQATKQGFKKVAVAGMVNDRWIAKMVGRVAAKLEQAQGEVGYTGDIPVALEPYRPKEPLAAKLLP
ncbi:uncharacterized protein AB675_211 [Cyphellophora attinorum]|uniref:Uncharacterized protein n=1 Tax=Cyphellophora attinorum TaxID=1664694 RepID=A0A0N1NX12_9EURO|nr:uncharacterized protein AB675_211 [Phialophora attinorum]KPI37757.1 hypothetical protein AB675_211 [Phialophora attinorum]